MDFEEDGEYEMRSEVKAFERAGPSGILTELMSAPTSISGKRGQLTEEDRFLETLDAKARKLSEEKILELSQRDINEMLERTKTISGLKYLNALGYILGYIATKGGGRIDALAVSDIIDNVLPKLGEENMGIEPPDVVRYARFWNKKV